MKLLLALLLVCLCDISSGQEGFRGLVTTVNGQIFSFLSSKNAEENLIISPLSIGVAISMLYHGTAGDSKKQLRSAFSLYDTEILRADASATLNKYMDAESNVTMRMGNGIFLNNGFKAKQRYTKLLETDYDAEIQTLSDNSNKVDTVNQWISNKTEGIIENFLSEGSITDDTKMLLLNAIYFYGPWLHPFEKSLTSLQRFNLAGEPKRYVVTEFMDLEETLELVDVPEKMKVVFLPYENENFTMVLYLPDEKISVDDLAADMFTNETNVQLLREAASKAKMNLQLPRFDLSTKNSLVEALEYLNVTDIFDDFSSDLSRISDQQISVGDIFHAASVKVDEEGSTAAAVSSISIDIRTSVTGPIQLIRFNRPFLFSIVDETGIQLFTGKVMKPTKKRPILDTETPTIADITEDSIIALIAPDTSVDFQPEISLRSSKLDTPTVDVKCPKGKESAVLEEFRSCEAECPDDHYGMCILGCWNKFCY